MLSKRTKRLFPGVESRNGNANGRFQVVPLLYLVGIVIIQRRFGSVLEDSKGDYVALDSHCANEVVGQ